MLRKKRKEKKLNQAELARLVGLKQRTISSYEIKENEMPVSTAKKIAKVLEVDWWKLYDD